MILVVWLTQIKKFTLEISDYSLHSNGLIDVPKVLADIVESAIGAVFIDSDSSLDTVWKVILFLHLSRSLFTIFCMCFQCLDRNVLDIFGYYRAENIYKGIYCYLYRTLCITNTLSKLMIAVQVLICITVLLYNRHIIINRLFVI